MLRWRCWLLLLLYLAGSTRHTAAQHTRCAPKISFFPKGGEDRNVPHAWGKTAQMAAGNYRDDTLYNIVLTSTNNLPGIVAEAVPILHIQPRHPLLVMGSTNLPVSCTGFVPQPAPEALVSNEPSPAAKTAPGEPGAAGEPADGAGPAAAAQDAAVAIAESAQIAGPGESAAAGMPAVSSNELRNQEQQQEQQEQQQQQQQQQKPAGQESSANTTLAAVPAVAAAAAGSNASSTAANQTQQQETATAARALLQSGSSSSVHDAGFDWQGEELLWGQQGRRLLGGEAVTKPASYRLQYSLNGSTPIDTGDVNMLTPVQRITLNGLKDYPDGHYCLTIKLTIVQGSGHMAGYIPVPPFDLHTITQVCFYKLDGLPAGKLSLTSCSENLSIQFKDLRPQPIPLYPGSSKSLFYSVFNLNSNLNRTKDWVWPPDSTPKSLSHWLVLNAANPAGRTHLWTPEEKVADGWYNLRLEASMTSDFPSLMALNSLRKGKYEGTLVPQELAEKPKYLATSQYKNGTVAGIQYVPTEFKQLTGPDEELKLAVGDEMQINWEFDGFGDMYCYIDGRLFNNMGDFNCRSPIQVRVPDRHNHTFRVALQDVCNQTFIVDAVYGPWGYKVLRAPAPRVRLEDVVSTGEKFEIGTPASATLRAPKANAAKSTHNSAGRSQPLPYLSMILWGLSTLWVALKL